ncbi:MAG: FecR domain-containing protein [Saprospiraceae bacterium]
MQELDIVLLLHKRITGEITPAESAVLESWIGASAQNACLAEEYARIWAEASEHRKTDFHLDMDAEFGRLMARLNTTEQRPPAKVITFGTKLLRAAAAVAFLLLATWGYRELTAPAPTVLVENNLSTGSKLAELPDGTRVWLRQKAKIEYPVAFSSSERRVQLVGEAYFEVAHQAERPFRVGLVHSGMVEVLGTRFNVRAETGTDEACVLVCEGKVRFSPSRKTKGTVLTANQRAVFNRTTQNTRFNEVSNFNELAWQTGRMEFDSTPLHQVLPDLEKHYGVRIELQDQSMGNCPYSALIREQNIEQVLEGFSLIYGFKVSKSAPDQYRLAGGVCQ